MTVTCRNFNDRRHTGVANAASSPRMHACFCLVVCIQTPLCQNILLQDPVYHLTVTLGEGQLGVVLQHVPAGNDRSKICVIASLTDPAPHPRLKPGLIVTSGSR